MSQTLTKTITDNRPLNTVFIIMNDDTVVCSVDHEDEARALIKRLNSMRQLYSDEYTYSSVQKYTGVLDFERQLLADWSKAAGLTNVVFQDTHNSDNPYLITCSNDGVILSTITGSSDKYAIVIHGTDREAMEKELGVITKGLENDTYGL
jgi:predicted DNA binding protein